MSVAKTYAKALYEAAQDAKSSAEAISILESQMDDFLMAMAASKDAQTALYGPLVSAKEKVALITEISKKGGFSPLMTQFLVLLARKRRLSILKEIREAFMTVRLASEGGVLGRLVAAETVSEADVEGLAKAFSKKLGKRVAFQISSDPSLLAGMKVTVNGVTYDGTLRSELQRLRDRISAGVSG